MSGRWALYEHVDLKREMEPFLYLVLADPTWTCGIISSELLKQVQHAGD